MADAIRLPKDRADQLRQLAQNMDDSTISAALGRLMQMAREQGLVEHGIPSVQINALSDGLAIRFDEGDTFGFTLSSVQELSDNICQCLRGENNGMRLTHICEPHNSSFAVTGRGNAISISIPEDAKPKMFSRDLASEFADLLEHEIANASS